MTLVLGLSLLILAILALDIATQTDHSIPLVLWLGLGGVSLIFLTVIVLQLAYRNNWLGAPIVLPPTQSEGDSIGLIFI